MNSFLTQSTTHPARRTGFTLTELMIVIGIIVLLVGILLAALNTVNQKAKATKTSSLMEGFRSAAETYQMEHGEFPGLVPDRVLAESPLISGTENALLAMMGGARVLSPKNDFPGNPTKVDYDNYGSGSATEISFGSTGWKIKVDVNRIGEGPRIDAKEYSPYFTPKQSEVLAVKGQYDPSGTGPSIELPDLVDAWGQPIIFVRRSRDIGAIVGDAGDIPPPQFSYVSGGGVDALVGTAQYVRSTALGKLEQNQTDSSGNQRYSIFDMGDTDDKIDTWRQVLEHPALDNEPRGAMALISAGPDGVYFSRTDGPGSQKEPIEETGDGSDFYGFGPSIIQEFDDIRVFGGN